MGTNSTTNEFIKETYGANETNFSKNIKLYAICVHCVYNQKNM